MINTTECRILLTPASDALRFLPEGPYSIGNHRVSWVAIQHAADSTVGSINILDLTSRTNQSYALPGRPGFAFPTDQDGVFVAGVERSLGLFDIQKQSWTEFATDVDASVDNTIINDGIVYRDNLIFGCKHLEFTEAKAGLYLWRRRDQALIPLCSDQICSNGKAVVTSDGGELSLVDIDSPTKKITIRPLNIDEGSVGPVRVVVDLNGEADEVFPDGMILTPDGQSLIVALYAPGDLAAGTARQYCLATGKLQAVWSCPGSPRVTCPQLVEVNGAIKLLLTTAVEHMTDEQKSQHTNAGCLFIGDTSFTDVGQQPCFTRL